MKQSISPNAKLTGYITPTSWDRDQHIKGISLLTTDHEEIRIVHDKKGDRLFSLVWEKVELTGRLENERGGKRRLFVTNYRTAEFDGPTEDATNTDEADIDNELREVFGTQSWSAEIEESDLPRGI
ncbi:MAG: hypothetical protein ABL958_10540 [Bdellovibrionia bacterium]